MPYRPLLPGIEVPKSSSVGLLWATNQLNLSLTAEGRNAEQSISKTTQPDEASFGKKVLNALFGCVKSD
jgi:hypothetical protein